MGWGGEMGVRGGMRWVVLEGWRCFGLTKVKVAPTFSSMSKSHEGQSQSVCRGVSEWGCLPGGGGVYPGDVWQTTPPCGQNS